MDIRTALVAHRKPAEAIQPRQCALHDPAVAADAWDDAAPAAGLPAAWIIVALVGMQLVRMPAWSAASAAWLMDRRDGIEGRFQQPRVMQVGSPPCPCTIVLHPQARLLRINSRNRRSSVRATGTSGPRTPGEMDTSACVGVYNELDGLRIVARPSQQVYAESAVAPQARPEGVGIAEAHLWCAKRCRARPHRPPLVTHPSAPFSCTTHAPLAVCVGRGGRNVSWGFLSDLGCPRCGRPK
jgi:hypothetical protein